MNQNRFIVTAFLISCLILVSCKTTQPLSQSELVTFNILQINDVYEIAPIEGGAAGGLARVATLKKDLLKQNPNTIAVIAGDFLSPSLIANLKENGERIAGRQMIEGLNAMGLDYATFGNHEFDISDPDLLQKRIHQSDFQFMSCNAMRVKEGAVAPFQQTVDGKKIDVPPYLIHEFQGPKGSIMKLAIIGVVLPFNRQDYVQYLPLTESFRMAYQAAQKEADMVIALTHLNMEDDIQLAKDVPGIPLFIGGHEHVNLNHYIEETVITKADANAKTAYIHQITFDPNTKLSHIKSSLQKIDREVPEDPETKKVVDGWQNKVTDILEGMGFNPNQKVMETKDVLVCTEAKIRSQPTNMGKLATAAIQESFPDANVCIMNSGSMRLDDNLTGTILEYDILRTFPFGGPMVSMEIPGNRLNQILNIGLIENLGEGGYFQIKNVSGEKDNWLINNQALDSNKKYKVALPQFVAEGKEANLGILAEFEFKEPKMLKIGDQSIPNDIRNMVIAYLQSL